METAQSLNPDAAVLAVEVGNSLKAEQENSILGLPLLTLNLAMEDRTNFSRRAADIVVRPRTEGFPFLEFHMRVDAEVQEGRRAFDERQEALEALLYGPDGALHAPGGALLIQAPPGLRSLIEALAAATLPPGPRLRRHYQKLVRRLYAQGWVQAAKITFTPEGPSLEAEPFPMLRDVEIQAPPPWRLPARKALEGAQVQPGAAFNPVALANALDRLLVLASLQGHPTLSAQGTSFDPASGRLRLILHEALQPNIRVAKGILSRAETAFLQRQLTPPEGSTTDMNQFVRNLELNEKRLALYDLKVIATSDGSTPGLEVTPVPDHKVTLEGVYAYESTWGNRGAVSVKTDRAFGSALALGFQASVDRVRNALEASASHGFGALPWAGWTLGAAQTQLNFLPELMTSPFMPSALEPALSGRYLTERRVELGLYARLGQEDRGLLSLAFSRRWSGLHPGPLEETLPTLDQVQARGEWDDFDRSLFPTRGTLVRLKASQGWASTGSGGEGTFHAGYLRVRKLWSLDPAASLEGDLETGLGWNLPLNTYTSAGGPAFLSGTPSSSVFTPNFALFRLGLPYRLLNVVGVNLQVNPRLDAGYVGGPSPEAMVRGPRVHGAELGVSAELGRWYCALAVGRWGASQPEGMEKTRVSVLFGAHPADLWK